MNVKHDGGKQLVMGVKGGRIGTMTLVLLVGLGVMKKDKSNPVGLLREKQRSEA